MFRVQALPAAEGDALLVEWGDAGRPHRALVDGGPARTYRWLHDRLLQLEPPLHLDLLVVTHIDGDHLEGAVRLLQDRESMGLSIGDVWFNGWPQVEGRRTGEPMGPNQGEMLGALLERDDLPWNVAFGGEPVQLADDGPPPSVPLPGGATATVLGPGRAQLRDLRKKWTQVLRASGLVPGHAEAALARLAERTQLSGLEPQGEPQGGKKLDDSVANASSISLLLEYDGHGVLLTGDSHDDVLSAGIDRVLAVRGGTRLPVQLVKLPHHGSSANVTASLLDRIEASRFLISTNGAYHRHPDEEAVDRVIALRDRIERPVELLFNYDCPTTAPWRERARPEHVVVRYPGAEPGLTVDL